MRKALSIILALVLTFTCLALTGCGSKNDPADDNSDTYIEGDNTADNNSEADAENTENTGSDNSKVEKDADGLYVYKLCNESVEIHINTNVWDYIDSDNVWDATRMAADLGFTNPVYWDKILSGFESENKMYKVSIWNDYEPYKPNSYNLAPTDGFYIVYGSERGDGGSVNMDTIGVQIYDNQFRERAQYGVKDTNVKDLGYMLGVSFETIVFTAAGMEECNGMIPESTIEDSLIIYLKNPSASAFLIP